MNVNTVYIRKGYYIQNLHIYCGNCGGNELKMHTLELFNKIADKNQIPQEWETGMVINTHKKETKRKCENYRRITLLPTAYKLFANIIRNKLNEHLGDEMMEEQCGFRKGRNCTNAIFTVQQIIEKKERTQLTTIYPICRL
jgi:hypothetical protein